MPSGGVRGSSGGGGPSSGGGGVDNGASWRELGLGGLSVRGGRERNTLKRE